MMRVALVQQAAGHIKTFNVQRGLDAVAEAADHGADLVCFAELGFERFYPQTPAGPNVRDLAESVPGTTVEAFQNGYFTALCNRVGVEEDLHFAGESFVCAPDGRVVAQAGAGEEILYADLDLAEVGRSHGRRLFLRDRRPELYAAWLGR